MPSIHDIYERKNYRNRIHLDKAITFEVEIRETNLQVQAMKDLSAKTKDSVFRYRYQIEEYLRQHPAFREACAPIQIYASAPEIVRFSDLSSRSTHVAPMALMSGAVADFVGRDLSPESQEIIVASGGDAFIKNSAPLEIRLYAAGSPWHDRLVLCMPALKKPYGISTYVPGRGIHAVTVVSRSACWAASFARDLGVRLAAGENPGSVMERAAGYSDVGGMIVIAGERIVVGGEMVLKSRNGAGAPEPSEN